MLWILCANLFSKTIALVKHNPGAERDFVRIHRAGPSLHVSNIDADCNVFVAVV